MINRLWAVAVAALLLGGMPAGAQAYQFQVKMLNDQKVERLDKPVRQEYELAVNAIDKINYESAFEHMSKAVELDPENVYLRHVLVEMALYLGDTRSSTDSIKYYDLAAMNLKEISRSSRLNKRELQRAQAALKLITDLRQTVGERDEKRRTHGREIAIQYARIVYQGQKDEEDANKKKRPPTATGQKDEEGGEGEAKEAAPEGK